MDLSRRKRKRKKGFKGHKGQVPGQNPMAPMMGGGGMPQPGMGM